MRDPEPMLRSLRSAQKNLGAAYVHQHGCTLTRDEAHNVFKIWAALSDMVLKINPEDWDEDLLGLLMDVEEGEE